MKHFRNRAPCSVAIEACGGSRHWARRLREQDSPFPPQSMLPHGTFIIDRATLDYNEKRSGDGLRANVHASAR